MTTLPAFNFDLGEDIDALRDLTATFVRRELAPRANEIDRTDTFPRDLWPKLGELGLLGLTVEPEWGGAGLGYLAHCVVMEEISRGSGSVGLSYGGLRAPASGWMQALRLAMKSHRFTMPWWPNSLPMAIRERTRV